MNIMYKVIAMTQVVYADILIVVNTYVNYALLRVSALICRKKVSSFRLALASLFGSAYSFIIFAPSISEFVIAFSRIAFAAVIVLVAFKINGKKDFFRLFGCFFLVSFVFAGMMFALQMLFSPGAMLYNNSVVYFNIDALTLAVFTALCYLILKIITRFISFKAPRNTVYEIEFEICSVIFKESAFLDTGNSLKEPFSSFPVIVCFDKIKSINKPETTLSDLANTSEIGIRIVPCTSLGGYTALKALRPERLHIKGIETDFTTDEVYIALSQTPIHGGDYSALLGASVFENNTKETEKDYVQFYR